MEALRQGASAATALDSNQRMVEYARSVALDTSASGLSVCQGEATELQRVLQEVHAHACTAIAEAFSYPGAARAFCRFNA